MPCDRFHRFVLDGMEEKRAPLRAAGVGYYPYVEPEPGAASGLLNGAGPASLPGGHR
jgi:hypothetical protein